MILNVRNTLAPLALVAVILASTACKGNAPSAGKEDSKDAAKKEEKREPVVKGIAGLDTERKQFSYMIGMDIGKSIAPVKDEVDMETLVEAMKTVMKDGKPLLTDEQAKQIGQAFGERMMAKQVADRELAVKKNLEEGAKFLADNTKKANVITTASGLQYQILRPANGPKPKATDTVLAHYVGTFLDGKKFDSSYDRGQPAEFALNGVIPGWTEGLQLMSKGSKFKFWIPANLAYGAEGQGSMPPNATLVFEVELQDVKTGSAEAMPQQAPQQ
jgi:FKBP-type peptidyl-prolyl cis-trans isomerase FkpA